MRVTRYLVRNARRIIVGYAKRRILLIRILVVVETIASCMENDTNKKLSSPDRDFKWMSRLYENLLEEDVLM
jgi:hypothetical protein